jgi:hypothetical protein
MGAGTDWGSEVHHSDYEQWVNSLTNSYGSSFTAYLKFDRLEQTSAYDATLTLAHDTTFDSTGRGRTAVWMDSNYSPSSLVFQERVCESLSLAVNLLADVLYTISELQVISQTDLIVWRGSSGWWYIHKSASDTWQKQWGLSGDKPLLGDYDGDDTKDLIVWRPSNGRWYILTSSSGYLSSISTAWGLNGDIPLVADFDGDLKCDLVVWRPSTGWWYVRKTAGGTWQKQWGLSGDTPLAGYFDGDSLPELVVWRSSNGRWYILKSTTTYTTSTSKAWGTSGDTPLTVN